MSLHSFPARWRASRRAVSTTWFVLALVIVAGIAVAVTAAYFQLKPAAPSPGRITVTDDLGRSVTVPNHPTRVAVLSPSIMDSVQRLGLRSHVVAVDCYAAKFGGLSADYSADQISRWNLSSSMCVQVGPTFDFEQLLNDSPDLVLASTIISVAAVQELSVTFHIPVVMLQPPTLSGIVLDVALLGQMFHVDTAATQLSTQLQAELGNASTLQQNLTNAGTPFPTVLVTFSANPAGSPSPGYYTFGPTTFGQSLIELASASSISAGAVLPYPELTGAQVLATDPQYVVYGVGFGLDLNTYSQGPDWSSLSAVLNGHSVGVDSNLLTEPDPTMVLVGLPALIGILHPAAAA